MQLENQNRYKFGIIRGKIEFYLDHSDMVSFHNSRREKQADDKTTSSFSLTLIKIYQHLNS